MSRPKQKNRTNKAVQRLTQENQQVTINPRYAEFEPKEHICPLCYRGKLIHNERKGQNGFICSKCSAKFNILVKNGTHVAQWTYGKRTYFFQYPITQEEIDRRIKLLSKRYKCNTLKCGGSLHRMYNSPRSIFTCDECGSREYAVFKGSELYFIPIKRKTIHVSMFGSQSNNNVERFSGSYSSKRSKGSASHVRYKYRRPHVGNVWK